MSKQSFSAARIQLTVLSLIATAASAIAGGILLVVSMTAEASNAGSQLEDLAVFGAFSAMGVGVLLVSFAMFVVGVTLSLLKIFRALEE